MYTVMFKKNIQTKIYFFHMYKSMLLKIKSLTGLAKKKSKTSPENQL